MKPFALIILEDGEEPQAAEVLVDGTIGGKPYRFLLDTGAARSAVVYDDYTSAFAVTDQHHSSGVFAKHSEDVITVPAIDVGPISKKDVSLVRLAQRHAGAKSLIGMDLLNDLCCHFYFDERRVPVGTGAEFGAGDSFQRLQMDSKFHPYVDVYFGAARASAVWDTGASMTIVDLAVIAQHPDHFEQIGQSAGTDATGTTMETPTFIMANAKIGGHVFPAHRVAGVDLSHVNSTVEIPMNMILGYSTLRHARWIFDFPRQQWAVSRMVE